MRIVCFTSVEYRSLIEIIETLIKLGYGPYQPWLVDGGSYEPTLKALARYWALLPLVTSSRFESPVPSVESSLISHLDSGRMLPIWLESTLSSLRIKLCFYKSYLGLFLNEAWDDKVTMITFGIPIPINKDRGTYHKYIHKDSKFLFTKLFYISSHACASCITG